MGNNLSVRLKVKEAPTKGLTEYFNKTLFNHPRHVLLQSEDAISFLLMIGDEYHGIFHCIIEEGVAYSPIKSLFGGFETSKKVNNDELRNFIITSIKSLKKKKVERIRITIPANFFRKPKTKAQRKILQELGFTKVLKLKNHHIEITKKTLLPQLHEMEKRKLKKCNKEGLAFYQEANDMLPILYNFISLCRKEKKQALNISLENLQQSMESFPENYFIFSVKLNNEIFAVTVAVRVNENILYNFLPASPTKFNHLSPMVKLIDGLYSYARSNHYKYLDLGVSTTKDGKDQDSLVAFKKHMGGIRSTKVVMEKQL